jgi:hypothetical protein
MAKRKLCNREGIGMTRTFSIASYPVVFTSNRVHDDLERRGEKQKERQRNSQTSVKNPDDSERRRCE